MRLSGLAVVAGLWSVMGCSPTSMFITEVDGGMGLEEDTSDSSSSSDDDEVDRDDTGEEDTGEEDTGEFNEDEYPLSWEGSRTFIFESDWANCEEEAFEAGIEITQEEWAHPFIEACPDCDAVFEIEMDRSRVCNNSIPLANPAYRGVIVDDDDNVQLVWFKESYDNPLQAEVRAEASRNVYDDFEYEYESSIWDQPLAIVGWFHVK